MLRHFCWLALAAFWAGTSRAATPDTRIVYAATNDNLYTINPDGTGNRALLPAPGRYEFPRWNPAKTRIVYGVAGSDARDDIWMCNADGTGAHVIAASPRNESDPDFSPGGGALVYLSSDTGQTLDELVMCDLNGKGARVLATGYGFSYPHFTPDGREIVYKRIAPSGSGAGLFRVPVEGGESRLLTDLGGLALNMNNFDISADGKRLVASVLTYYQPSVMFYQLFTANFDGTNRRQLLSDIHGASTPSWSADGQQVIFTAYGNDFSPARLMKINADGRGLRVVRDFSGERGQRGCDAR